MANPSNPTPSFEDYLAFLQKKGSEQYGSHFTLHPADHEILYKLLVYFIGDTTNADKLGLNLQKGIMLTGPVGCGKTTLMNLMRHFTPQKHIMKPCRDISFEFIQDGYEVIHRYARQGRTGSRTSWTYQTYCFDDLGTENNLKYYGNECNVMAEVILSRYDLFVSNQVKTHITSNLGAAEIEQYYGNRVRSRMREMLNLIAFNKMTGDKRK